MVKTYIVTYISHDKKQVTLSEVITCKSKKTGEQMSFISKNNPKFKEMVDGDFVGKKYEVSESFK